jgi:hypothetical protein
MEKTQIASIAFQALAPFMLAVLTWLGAKASQLISVRVRNERLRAALLRLDDAVLSIVRELQQVTVEPLKASSTDGRIPDGTKEAIRQAALAGIRAHLGPHAVAELIRTLGIGDEHLDRIIGTKVEAAVHALRTDARLLNGVHTEPVPLGAVPQAR